MKQKRVGVRKKYRYSLFVLVLLLGLTIACGNQHIKTTNTNEQPSQKSGEESAGEAEEKSEEVKKVERLIDGIGEVTLEKEQFIIDAENAYAQLYEIDKRLVDNYNLLISAREKYNELINERNKAIELMITEAYKYISDFDVKTAQRVLKEAKDIAVTEKQLSSIDDAQALLSSMVYDGFSVIRLEHIYSFINEYKVHEDIGMSESVYTYTFSTNNSTAGDYSDSLLAYKEYLDEYYSLVSTAHDTTHAADVYSYSSNDGEMISITRYAAGYPVIGYFVITISK